MQGHVELEVEPESEKTTVIQKIKKLKTRSKKGVVPPIASLRYFGITLREPRTLQIIHPTPDIYSVIVSVVKSVWRPGIAEIKDDYNQEVRDIKLNGSPFWFSFSNEFALQVHYTILKLIDRLDKKGYQLIIATDVARYFELSTLFFTEKPKDERSKKKDPFQSNPHRSQYMSVTISHNNQLQLANCSLSNKLAITQLINNTWHYGINKEISLPSGYIIVLNGAPWSNKKLAFSARSLLHQLTLLLTQRKWNLVTTARIKNHRDSLIFQYKEVSTFDMSALHATFLSLSLSEKDKLRVIHCSDNNLIQDLKEIIMKIWKPGLLSDYKKSGGHEFVLAEKPWWCESTEAIKTRYFICDMLELLYARGFKIHAAIECHPDLIEKTTLTFKKGPARRVKVVCISFDENDKVRVINGSQVFVNAIRSVLSNRVGSDGIQKEREFLKSVEFTLSDLNMWDGKNRRDAQVGKSLCCHILQKVGELGWRVVLSADATSAVKGNNNRHDIPMDVHSWYLIQASTTNKAFQKLRKKKADPRPRSVSLPSVLEQYSNTDHVEEPRRAFTARSMQCNNMNYWQRLQHLSLFSVQRLEEVLFIIEMWEIVRGISPNNDNIKFCDHLELGKQAIVPVYRGPSIGRPLFDKSFAVIGPRLWNIVPQHIKDITTSEDFKTSLRIHSMEHFPDRPPLKGYGASNDNSLLSWAKQLQDTGDVEKVLSNGSEGNSVASIIVQAEAAQHRALSDTTAIHTPHSPALDSVSPHSPTRSYTSLKANIAADSVASIVSEGTFPSDRIATS